MYDQYVVSYKAELHEMELLDGKKHILDRLKMNFLSRIFPFELKKVVVRPSTTHGVGVFAARNISSGELVTFYPGDAVEYMPNKDRHLPNCLTASLFSQRMEDRFSDKDELRTVGRDNDYAVDINDSYAIVGSPFFNNNPDYAGHLINDGAKSSSTAQSDAIYCRVSALKRNCLFRTLKGDLHLAIVAGRDIKEGEELFVSYGTKYWQSYNSQRNHPGSAGQEK